MHADALAARDVADDLFAANRVATAGADVNQVVRTTVFMIDLGEFAAMNEIYASYFSAPYPARSTVQVVKLPRDVRVEIDVIAVLSS